MFGQIRARAVDRQLRPAIDCTRPAARRIDKYEKNRWPAGIDWALDLRGGQHRVSSRRTAPSPVAGRREQEPIGSAQCGLSAFFLKRLEGPIDVRQVEEWNRKADHTEDA